MRYSEFKRHLGKAGFTVNLFASYLNVKSSSVSNYAKQEKVPHSYALLAVLLGDMGDRNIDIKSLLSRFDIHPYSSNSDENVHQMEIFRNKRKSGLEHE